MTSDKLFCYESVKTSAYDLTPQRRCFSVAPNGTFSKVWNINDGDVPKEASLRKGAVIPGLWDGHGHILGLGDSLATANLYFSCSMQDTLSRLKAFSEKHPDAGSKANWLRGSGWDQAAFGRMPTANDLDELFPEKYVILTRVDGHCLWVSNAVIDLLPDPIPNVPGGEIIGRGVFCDNAMDMIYEKWPKPDAEKQAQMIINAMRELNKVGIVGVHDAGVKPDTLSLYKKLVETKNWTVRVYAMLECPVRNTFCPSAATKFARPDGLLSMRSVKLFADGALGSWGSALLDPYTDRPDSHGTLLISPSIIKSLTHSWAKAGFQVNIHAIGDRANRCVIDAFSSALEDPDTCPSISKKDCQLEKRFRIEHAQIVSPPDAERLHELGILPSVQPTHATSDMAYAHLRLGDDRLRSSAYRLRSFLSQSSSGTNLGPNIILGSDFPVEPPAPLHGMYAAVARRSPQTRKGPPYDVDGHFLPAESLTIEEALAGFTTGPAWGGFMEGNAGQIAEGRWADWVVLNKSLEEAGVDGLLDLKVMETWVGGRRVYISDES